MSLLMDALKKAELAKRQQAAGAPETAPAPAPVELELAPLEAPQPPKATRTPSLDVLEQDYLPAPGTKPAEPPPAARAAQPQPRPPRQAPPSPAEAAQAQAAAKNVFAAKEESESNRLFLIGVVAFSVIAVAVIGVYFWLQLRPPASGIQTVASAPPVQPRPATAAPAAPIASPVPSAAPAKPRKEQERAPATAGKDRPRWPAASVPGPEDPIRITAAKLRVDPTLAHGYEAFSAGNLADARADYEAVLRKEPKNADALLGIAAVSLRQGRNDLAEEYYVRALEADPKNGLAQAGLISLHSQTDPVQAESRLKSLIAAQPDLAPLHFALGNLYARQGRWNEAQGAFFKAYTGDAENPDYLFNLAVSLDHLHQARLAAQYYTQALAAAKTRTANFDAAQATARLRELN